MLNAIPDLIEAFTTYTINMTWPKLFLCFYFLITCCTRFFKKMWNDKNIFVYIAVHIEIQYSHFTDKAKAQKDRAQTGT